MKVGLGDLQAWPVFNMFQFRLLARYEEKITRNQRVSKSTSPHLPPYTWSIVYERPLPEATEGMDQVVKPSLRI